MYTVTGRDSRFALQVLAQCGSTFSCLSRSVRQILAACWRDVKKPADNHTGGPESDVTRELTGRKSGWAVIFV